MYSNFFFLPTSSKLFADKFKTCSRHNLLISSASCKWLWDRSSCCIVGVSPNPDVLISWFLARLRVCNLRNPFNPAANVNFTCLLKRIWMFIYICIRQNLLPHKSIDLWFRNYAFVSIIVGYIPIISFFYFENYIYFTFKLFIKTVKLNWRYSSSKRLVGCCCQWQIVYERDFFFFENLRFSPKVYSNLEEIILTSNFSLLIKLKNISKLTLSTNQISYVFHLFMYLIYPLAFYSFQIVQIN